MQHDVERRDGNTELRSNFITRSFFEHALPDRLRVTRIDRSESRFDAGPRFGEISFFAQLDFSTCRGSVFRSVDFAFEIHRIVKQFPSTGAQNVERDPQRDDAKPWIDARVLPLKLVKSFDDTRVRLGQRILGERFTSKTWQQHGAIKNGAVTTQDLSERSSITRLRANTKLTLGFQIRSRLDDGHGRHDTRMRSRPHRRHDRRRSRLSSRAGRPEPDGTHEQHDRVELRRHGRM